MLLEPDDILIVRRRRPVCSAPVMRVGPWVAPALNLRVCIGKGNISPAVVVPCLHIAVPLRLARRAGVPSHIDMDPPQLIVSGRSSRSTKVPLGAGLETSACFKYNRHGGLESPGGRAK
jgi:hypothetical protein